MIPFLYWLYLTPDGQACFVAFLAITALLVKADSRRRPTARRTTFDLELELLRRNLRVYRDPRRN